MRIVPQLPPGVAIVTETAADGGIHVHPGWRDALPWLVQAITSHGEDMSLFGASATADVLPRWAALRDGLGCDVIVHARQVHGAAVHAHGPLPPGLLVVSDADGHATSQPRTLLAVSVADCVPISIAAPDVRAICLLHGGWRGVAAGILQRGVGLLADRFGARADAMHVHFGPAICGACYEVGAEVLTGLDLEDAAGGTHADVRATLAHRALALGIARENISTSSFCTRHGDSPFFSHRGGCRERQVSVLAVR
ncbi:MAG TPA: polyphenol oxidase family protein [Longimicrobiales bacterium]|nr:polyphenol oxidase family protein [Longimicrobiales bacterium]